MCGWMCVHVARVGDAISTSCVILSLSFIRRKNKTNDANNANSLSPSTPVKKRGPPIVIGGGGGGPLQVDLFLPNLI